MDITIENIKNYKIQNYIDVFTESGEDGKAKFLCRVDCCGSELSSSSAAIRHLKRVHHDIHDAIAENKTKSKSPNPSDENLIEIQVKVSVAYIWDAMIHLVVFNGLAFATFVSSGFKKLLYPIIAGLQNKNIRLTINTENLKEKIKNRTIEMKDHIRHELKGKIICLMLDIATRHNRAIFGINVAFFDGNEIQIRTLAMCPIRISHTAKNLYSLVKDILAEYNILMEQVLAVTTDNAKNMLKMTRLMNKDLMNIMRDILDDDSMSMFSGNIPADDELDEDDGEDVGDGGETREWDEYDFDPEIFDTIYFTDLLVSLRKEIEGDFCSLITSISCAAHTINLVVSDAIKSCPEIKSTIDRARELVKKLRTPTLRSSLEKSGHRMPLIDVSTRWSSIHTMVRGFETIKSLELKLISSNFIFQLERLLEHEQFCRNLSESTIRAMKLKDILLTDDEWLSIADIVNVLHIFSVKTKVLQTQTMCLSDFYGHWLTIRLSLRKFPTEFGQSLLKFMLARESALLDNVVMAANVYLDPRFQKLLSKQRKECAISFLKSLCLRMNALENPVTQPAEEDNDFNESDELAKFLDEIPEQTNDEVSTPRNEEKYIENLLNHFQQKGELKLSFMQFWNQEKSNQPELFKLFTAVCVVQPTQTTVERGFSSLPIVFTHLRTKMLDENLENILFLRNNKTLYQKLYE